MATKYEIPVITTRYKSVPVTESPAVRELFLTVFSRLYETDIPSGGVMDRASLLQFVRSVVPGASEEQAIKIFKKTDYMFSKISETVEKLREGYKKSGMGIQFDMNIRDYMDVIIIILFYKEFGSVTLTLVAKARITQPEYLDLCNSRLLKGGEVCDSAGKREDIDSGLGYKLFLSYLMKLRPQF